MLDFGIMPEMPRRKGHERRRRGEEGEDGITPQREGLG